MSEHKPAERDETDRSLGAERIKTDQELLKGRTAVEDGADAVVARAREAADTIVQTARDRADRQPGSASATRKDSNVLRNERQAEDTNLLLERREADDELETEREERRLFFASLLRVERSHTDERLLLERSRADRQSTTRDEFMGLVSHDLRTMLSGIALSSEALARQAAEDDTGRNIRIATDRIGRFTVRMNRLISDLLDVASIEVGRLAVKPEQLDAGRLVRETEDAFQPAAAAHGIALEVEPFNTPLLAMFDHDRILQVLGNLISNAIKFTPTAGRITLRVEQTEAEVRFSVRDTGAGIAKDKHEAVFDRFWQASKDDRRGLGLGLYISKAIVEGHGGRIWVESEVGQGSTFVFSLPAAVPTSG